jgi:hypothetical protein
MHAEGVMGEAQRCHAVEHQNIDSLTRLGLGSLVAKRGWHCDCIERLSLIEPPTWEQTFLGAPAVCKLALRCVWTCGERIASVCINALSCLFVCLRVRSAAEISSITTAQHVLPPRGQVFGDSLRSGVSGRALRLSRRRLVRPFF